MADTADQPGPLFLHDKAHHAVEWMHLPIYKYTDWLNALTTNPLLALDDNFIEFGAATLILEHPILSLDTRVSNVAFNNYSNIQLSFDFMNIVGQGLKYVPGQEFISESEIGKYYDEFARRYLIKMHFDNKYGIETKATNDPALHGIYVPNPNFMPTPMLNEYNGYYCFKDECKKTFVERVQQFHSEMKPHTSKFSSKKVLSKLRELSQIPNVFWKSSDKNLGLTLVSKDWYLKQCQLQVDDFEVYNPYPDFKVERILDIAYKDFEKIYEKYNVKRVDHPETGETVYLDNFTNSPIFFDKVPFDVLINSIRGTGRIVPTFHGIVKIHKDPITIRPIAASHSWFTNTISRYVAKELGKLCKLEPFICCSSRDLLKALDSETKFEKGSILVSADVQSLYPNIPRDKMRNYLLGAISKINSNHNLQLDVNYIHFLLDIIMWIHKYHFVEFEGKTYDQHSGCAMGDPSAPLIANLFMYKFYDIVTDKIKNDKAIVNNVSKCHWEQACNYIDDAFMIFPPSAGQRLERIFSIINSILPTIKLTYEYSTEIINFLDLQIYFDDNYNITTKLHVKLLNRFLYIPFRSAHPKHQLSAWIKAETYRIVVNSGNHADFIVSFKTFNTNLRNRGYPHYFLVLVFDTIPRYSKEFRHALLYPTEEKSNRFRSSPTVPLSFRTTAAVSLKPQAVGRILTLTLQEKNDQLGPYSLESTGYQPMVSLRKGKSIRNHLIRSKHW